MTCWERIAPYVIKPNNYMKVFWDIAIGIVYLLCFWLDPFLMGSDFLVYSKHPDLN